MYSAIPSSYIPQNTTIRSFLNIFAKFQSKIQENRRDYNEFFDRVISEV